VRISPQVRVGDGGEVSATIVEDTVVETSGEIGNAFSKLLYGRNAESMPAAPAGMEFIDGSVSPGDDGDLNYSLRYMALLGVVDETTSTGGGVTVYKRMAHRAAPGTIPPPAGGRRKRVSVEMSGDDQGKVSSQVQVVELAETNNLIHATNVASTGRKWRITSHENVDPGDITDLGTSTHKVRISPQVRVGDGGEVSATIVEDTVVETSGEIGNAHSKLLYGRNKSSLPSAPAGMEFDDGSVQPGDDGELNYALRYLSTLGVTEAVVSTGGIVVEAKAGKGSAIGSIPPPVGGKRRRVSISLNPDKNGRVDWDTQVQELVKSSGRFAIGPHVLYYGSNEDTLPTIDAADRVVGGSVGAKDDGALDWMLSARDTGAAPSLSLTFSGGGFSATLEQKSGVLPADVPSATAPAVGQNGVLETRLDGESGLASYTKLVYQYSLLSVSGLNVGAYLFPTVKTSVENAQSGDVSALTPPLAIGQSRRADIRIDDRTGKATADVSTITARESQEVTTEESDGLIVKTRLEKRNATTPYALGSDVGATAARITDEGRLDIIKETLEADPSVATLSTIRTFKSNKVDWKWEDEVVAPTSQVSRTEMDGGDLVRKTFTYQKRQFYRCKTRIDRTITITVEEQYALKRSALSLPVLVAPADGSKDGSIELVRAGLWRMQIVTEENSEPIFTRLTGWEEWAPLMEIYSADFSAP
jgi:hypothetical protein